MGDLPQKTLWIFIPRRSRVPCSSSSSINSNRRARGCIEKYRTDATKRLDVPRQKPDLWWEETTNFFRCAAFACVDHGSTDEPLHPSSWTINCLLAPAGAARDFGVWPYSGHGWKSDLPFRLNRFPWTYPRSCRNFQEESG